MAATQQQRAKLYTTLAETMGDEAADTLMDEFPPGGWEQMATKQDLAGVEARLTAAMTAGFAELNVKSPKGSPRPPPNAPPSSRNRQPSSKARRSSSM